MGKDGVITDIPERPHHTREHQLKWDDVKDSKTINKLAFWNDKMSKTDKEEEKATVLVRTAN